MNENTPSLERALGRIFSDPKIVQGIMAQVAEVNGAIEQQDLTRREVPAAPADAPQYRQQYTQTYPQAMQTPVYPQESQPTPFKVTNLATEGGNVVQITQRTFDMLLMYVLNSPEFKRMSQDVEGIKATYPQRMLDLENQELKTQNRVNQLEREDEHKMQDAIRSMPAQNVYTLDVPQGLDFGFHGNYPMVRQTTQAAVNTSIVTAGVDHLARQMESVLQKGVRNG